MIFAKKTISAKVGAGCPCFGAFARDEEMERGREEERSGNTDGGQIK
jgi:hypothetical protein